MTTLTSTPRRVTLAIGQLAMTLALSTSAAAQAAETAPDDTWISVSGTIVSTTPASFRLDYGDGVITVEMDDFDFYGEGRALMVNDEVVVSGIVDDDLFERRTIEASSVFVESLGTYFYANPADEEDAGWYTATPIEVGEMQVLGTVTAIDGRDFIVDTGLSQVRVDTSEMYYNPMDDEGFLRIEIGDRVKVDGELDYEFWDGRELEADYVVELSS